MARIDYDTTAAGYARGREMPLDALLGWREAIARHLPANASLIVDVGSGTGLFTDAMARWFDVEVVGIEPSAGMRREAALGHPHERVSYAAGEAEHLPLRDSATDFAWLSTVIHHFRDLRAAARELARVLRPSGVVLIRSSFPGRHRGISLFSRFFPAAGRIAMSFPSLESTEDAFAAAGYRLRAHEEVDQVSSPSLAAYLEGCARGRTRR
jgi:ubiquinone/menaquinone biosynthesis C-methylase UbiE